MREACACRSTKGDADGPLLLRQPNRPLGTWQREVGEWFDKRLVATQGVQAAKPTDSEAEVDGTLTPRQIGQCPRVPTVAAGGWVPTAWARGSGTGGRGNNGEQRCRFAHLVNVKP